MLRQLEIENIALIEKMIIPFERGLNVLTGETGAGKSVIINALKLVLGARTVGEEVSQNKNKGTIQALFSISSRHSCILKLREYGLIDEESTDLILSRELRTGKNICRINGKLVPLSMLREIGQLLVDLQGQHEQHSLLKENKHMALLDSFGNDEFQSLKESYEVEFNRYLRLKNKLSELKALDKDKLRKIDMLQFQLTEIEEAQLRPKEEDSLRSEKKILANSEKLSSIIEKTNQHLLRGGLQQASVLDLLAKAVVLLQEGCKVDDSLNTSLKVLEDSLYQLEDVARDIEGYYRQIEFNPQKLDQIENRLALLGKLKRKYGDKIEDVLDYRDKICDELAVLEGQEIEADNLEAELTGIEELLANKSLKLSEVRSKIAGQIQEEITKELTELGMPKVNFKIQLSQKIEFTDSGRDDVEFLISPNPGQPLKPLAKIASGGEVSRIFLALKTVLTKGDEILTLIFDEIDSGLGGHGVQVVAEKLDYLANFKQVICITHSPQIAGISKHHLLVTKLIRDNATKSYIKILNFEEKILELSRMMQGTKVTETTIKHAKEMLQNPSKS